jgi:hypothetical protein
MGGLGRIGYCRLFHSGHPTISAKPRMSYRKLKSAQCMTIDRLAVSSFGLLKPEDGVHRVHHVRGQGKTESGW